MPSRLQDIRNFSVMICNPQNYDAWGTGFIVNSDSDQLKIVTAAHIVTNLFKESITKELHSRDLIGKKVGIRFFQPIDSDANRKMFARIVASFSDFDDDVIILELEGRDPRQNQNYAMLGNAEESRDHPYISYGFAEIGGEYPGGRTDGLILDLSPSKINGEYQCEMVQLQANSLSLKIKRGMSGAAVLDKYRNLVVGIVVEFWSQDQSGVAWAANCKVLSFSPMDLTLIQASVEATTSAFSGQAYDRTNYEYINKLGSKLIHTPKPLKNWVGRQSLLFELDRYYWLTPECKLLELVGFGGEGKSSLAQKWMEQFFLDNDTTNPKKRPEYIFWWDFYYQPNVDGFIADLLVFLTGNRNFLTKQSSLSSRVKKIEDELNTKGVLLVLDGLEVMQLQTEDRHGEIENKDLADLIKFLADENHKSFCLVTTRVSLLGLANYYFFKSIKVDHLTLDEGITLLTKLGVKGKKSEIEQLVLIWEAHPLTLTILGMYLYNKFNGKLGDIFESDLPLVDESFYERIQHLLLRYDEYISIEERLFLQIFSAFRSPVNEHALENVFRNPNAKITRPLVQLSHEDFQKLIQDLVQRGLIRTSEPTTEYKPIHPKKRDTKKETYIIHPIIRSYFYDSLLIENKKDINLLLISYVQQMRVPKMPRSVSQMKPLIDEVYYLCESKMYEEAYDVYMDQIIKIEEMPENETGYLTTILSAYQTDVNLIRQFFPNGDWAKEPLLISPRARVNMLLLAGVDLEALGNTNISGNLFEDAAQMGLQIGELDYAVWSYQNKSYADISTGNINEGLRVANMAINYAKQLGTMKADEMGIYARIAWGHFLLGETDAAFVSMNTAQTLIESKQDGTEKYMADFEGAIFGEILIRTGKLEDATKIIANNLLAFKAKKVPDDLGFHRLWGMVYAAQRNFRKAIEYFNKAVILARKYGLKEETVFSLLNRGRLYLENKFLIEADTDFYEALSIAQDCSYMWALDARNSLIQVELERSQIKDRYSELKKELLKIYSTANRIGYKWAAGDALFLLGYLEQTGKNLEQSKKYYQQCLAIRQDVRDARTNIVLEKLDEIN